MDATPGRMRCLWSSLARVYLRFMCGPVPWTCGGHRAQTRSPCRITSRLSTRPHTVHRGRATAVHAGALAAVAGAVHAFRRHREIIRRRFAMVLEYARRFEVIERSIARSRRFVPGSYLALHLVLGLVATAAI